MIYWDIILDNEKVPEALQSLYNHAQSIHDMAAFLGVSVTALRNEMKRCGIVVRQRNQNIPIMKFPPTPDPLLSKYTTWVLRQRGIKMMYKQSRKK